MDAIIALYRGLKTGFLIPLFPLKRAFTGRGDFRTIIDSTFPSKGGFRVDLRNNPICGTTQLSDQSRDGRYAARDRINN